MTNAAVVVLVYLDNCGNLDPKSYRSFTRSIRFGFIVTILEKRETKSIFTSLNPFPNKPLFLSVF